MTGNNGVDEFVVTTCRNEYHRLILHEHRQDFTTLQTTAMCGQHAPNRVSEQRQPRPPPASLPALSHHSSARRLFDDPGVRGNLRDTGGTSLRHFASSPTADNPSCRSLRAISELTSHDHRCWDADCHSCPLPHHTPRTDRRDAPKRFDFLP